MQLATEVPRGLPSMYCPGPILLNFSVLMETGVTDIGRAAGQKVTETAVFNQAIKVLHNKLDQYSVHSRHWIGLATINL